MPVAATVAPPRSDNFSATAVNGKIFLIDGLSVWAYSPPVYMFTKN